MPIQDRRADRILQIEFPNAELLAEESIADRMRLIIIAKGSATLLINGQSCTAESPAVLALNPLDRVRLINSHQFEAISFNFSPTFLNSSFTFEALKENDFPTFEERHDRNLLRIFHRERERFFGLASLSPTSCAQILTWMKVIGDETVNQSDGWWSCRIRRYLLQILFLVEEVYQELLMADFAQKPTNGDKYVLAAQEYVHTHYPEDISADDLCQLAGLNRTSLNERFKKSTGRTMIDYLISHRLNVACDSLVHTGLKIKEISESCGFMDDAYFNKQFVKRLGLTPLAYRERERNKQSA